MKCAIPHLLVLVSPPELRGEGGIDTQKPKEVFVFAGGVADQVVMKDHVYAIAAEDREVPFQLVGKGDHPSIEKVLAADGTWGQPPSLGAILLGGEGIGEVGDLLLAIEQQLAVLRMHHINGVAQHDDDARIRRAGLDLSSGTLRIQVPGRRLPHALMRLRPAKERKILLERQPAVPTGEVVSKEQWLLVERHEDLRMLLQVGEHRRRAALRRAHNEEVGQAPGRHPSLRGHRANYAIGACRSRPTSRNQGWQTSPVVRREFVQVAIVGLGYVGAVTAACIAELGSSVICVDRDSGKADAIAAGRSPIAEPGLDDLLTHGVGAGRIRVSNVDKAVAEADAIMIAVGTPSALSGALDLTAVVRVAEEIGSALPHDGRFRTIVVRSTVLAGTTEEQVKPVLEQASGLKAGVEFGLAMNPEFLREGSSIRDFFEASRTIIGANDEHSAEQVKAAYEGLGSPFEVVPIRVAEMVKYTDNAFHATKIAFANEIASFARGHGVDGREVMRLMVADDRLNISPAYLRPGYAFGGSCLPKDLRAITDRARKTDIDLPLLNAALQSNAAHFERGARLVEEAGGRNVALLGLSFKGSTDDLRESPAVALAERLIGRGYRLAIYDPDVDPALLRGANRPSSSSTFRTSSSSSAHLCNRRSRTRRRL